MLDFIGKYILAGTVAAFGVWLIGLAVQIEPMAFVLGIAFCGASDLCKWFRRWRQKRKRIAPFDNLREIRARKTQTSDN